MGKGRDRKGQVTACPIKFPALAFGEEIPNCAVPGVEGLEQLSRLDQLLTGSIAENERRLTWEIVDRAGGCWAIAESPVVGRPSRLGRVLAFVTRAKPTLIFEPRFKRLAGVSLDQTKARIVAAMRGNPLVYIDFEGAAERGELENPEPLVEPLCAKVAAAKTFEKAFDAIYWYGGAEEEDDAELTPEALKIARRWKIGCTVVPIAIPVIVLLVYLVLPPPGQAGMRHFLGEVAVLVFGTAAVFTVIGGFMWLRDWLVKPRRRRG